jgi:hypothetical protein
LTTIFRKKINISFSLLYSSKRYEIGGRKYSLYFYLISIVFGSSSVIMLLSFNSGRKIRCQTTPR